MKRVRKAFFAMMIAVIIFFNNCYSQHAFSVPLSFNISNHYNEILKLPQAIVIVTDKNESVIYDNKNFHFSHWWRQTPVARITQAGIYKIHVTFYEDSTLVPANMMDSFTVSGEEKEISLQVNLQFFREQDNGIYVDKYFGNLYNAILTEVPDTPQMTKTKRRTFPGYEWQNNSDSVLYGIQYTASGNTSVGASFITDIAVVRVQQFNLGEWYDLNCGMSLTAALKKRQVGKTIKEANSTCPLKYLAGKSKYRVLIEYGMKGDVINKITEAKDGSVAWHYRERHIYQLTDDFTL